MADIKDILERIENKKADYGEYGFSQVENNALTAFFDLAQEYDNMEDFFKMCVSVPKGFFGFDSSLYVVSPKHGRPALVSTTLFGKDAPDSPPPEGIHAGEHPYYSADGGLVLTIRGKRPLADQLPFNVKDDVLGLLIIYAPRPLGPHSELFFEKYANRIGFNIHNKLILEKNVEHLRFIRSLVHDIEHNIIAPNMVYKLFLRNMKVKITRGINLEKKLREPEGGQAPADVLAELQEVNRGLGEEFENIEKHYRNMSLFLETLLRRSHFDQGRLTLRTKLCNVKKDIVLPQLDRFAEKFRKMGIAVDDRLSGIPEEEVISVVDAGLIAQVYANLFSNALKYTDDVYNDRGEKLKYISYGREVLGDFFGQGKNGIKYNVFSTGRHIELSERHRIFDEEFRGSNSAGKSGTGHGLAFIKNAVEIHGGTAGYEPTQYGNNFFFILPVLQRKA